MNGAIRDRLIVSHGEAHMTTHEVVQMKFDASLGKEMQFTRSMEMEKGKLFYNLFCHIGTCQCVGGEISNRDKVTSRLDTSATVNTLGSMSSKVSFCTSAIAWNGCPATSNETTSATISVPLEAKEERFIRQISHELTPMHVMTKEQLVFSMEGMVHTMIR